jgi:pimeloyl-ACP methyl ester carboxylesterase
MPEDYVAASSDKMIQLHDGRTLGYAEYGQIDGKALFYFHGFPGARVEARFLAEQAKQQHVRLIGVDRPGMGLSTFKPNRHYLDWPDDVVELAESLHINQFAVAGFSGGSPYVFACAYKIPKRLTGCGIISGAGLVSPFLAFLSQWVPRFMMPVLRRSFRNKEQAQKTLEKSASNWIEADTKSFLVPGIKELIVASLVEGFRQGARGATHEGVLFGRPWGFRLEEIKFPSMFLWHGELDTEAPVATARDVAGKLTQCKATYYPGEGHISLIVNHAQDILKALIGA